MASSPLRLRMADSVETFLSRLTGIAQAPQVCLVYGDLVLAEPAAKRVAEALAGSAGLPSAAVEVHRRPVSLAPFLQDLRAGQESADDGTEDIVDRANNAYNRELMFSLSDNERATLLQIENALGRMDEGSYGRCANCGQSIAVQRLEAVPWARFCIDCQELAEKGLLEVEAS